MNGGPAGGKQIVHGEQKPSQDAVELQRILEASAPELVKQMSRKKREELASILALRQTTVTYSHSGPLPSPEDLRKYDSVAPGTAERIITMAENQQNHRIGLEKHAVTEQLRQSHLGQRYGLVVTISMIVASFILILCGHDTAGASLGGSTIAALAAVFVIGKKAQEKDLTEKQSVKKKG